MQLTPNVSLVRLPNAPIDDLLANRAAYEIEVAAAYRRQGIGKQMIELLKTLCLERWGKAVEPL